jgi:DNA-binding transcriptional LysR family regulator
MDSLTGILAFVRTAESLSFVAAGRALGISASAVGKSVARLEQSVGVRLFHRSTRRVSLTAEGRLFYERCSRIIEDLHDAEAMLSYAAQTPRGKLRITLPTIGYRFLLPVLPSFSALYPEIEVEFDFNDRLVDIVEEGFDVAIRSGDLRDSSLMSRRLGPFRFLLCASPAYLLQMGIPQVPGDLEHHRCVRFRFPATGKIHEWRLEQNGAPCLLPHLEAALTCNNMEALRGAAIQGFGVAYMPDFVARDAIEAGELQTVLDNCLVHSGQFWAVWPSSRHLSPKIRAFVDFAADRLFAESGEQRSPAGEV